MISRTRLLALPAAAALALLLSTTASADITALSYNSPANLSVSNTEATVTGLVVCSLTDVSVDVTAQIIQSQGRHVIIASGSTTVLCATTGSGSPQQWTVLASTPQGAALKPGSASIFISAFNSTFTSSKSVSGPISLH